MPSAAEPRASEGCWHLNQLNRRGSPPSFLEGMVSPSLLTGAGLHLYSWNARPQVPLEDSKVVTGSGPQPMSQGKVSIYNQF